MHAMELTLHTLRRRLAVLIERGLALLDDVAHPYRPELHYMRGPGPKWHARHPSALRD